jgi:hypothetical protein
MPFGWGEEFKKINCPNGNVRYVLRKLTDIGKAFSLYAPEVDYLFKGSLNGAQSLAEGSVEIGVKKKAQQIFENLDSVHIDAVNKFAMSYSVYMTSPCEDSAYKDLLRAVENIQRSINTLRDLESNVSKLKTKTLGESDMLAKMDHINSTVGNLSDIFT